MFFIESVVAFAPTKSSTQVFVVLTAVLVSMSVTRLKKKIATRRLCDL